RRDLATNRQRERVNVAAARSHDDLHAARRALERSVRELDHREVHRLRDRLIESVAAHVIAHADDLVVDLARLTARDPLPYRILAWPEALGQRAGDDRRCRAAVRLRPRWGAALHTDAERLEVPWRHAERGDAGALHLLTRRR